MSPAPRPERFGRSLSALGLSLALAVAPLAWAGSGSFEFGSLNRRYERLAPEMVPVVYGPLTAHLSSPEHQLDLLHNRVVLKARGDGVFDAGVELEFAGSGRLVADLDLSGASSRLEDLLTVPQQKRTLFASVRIFKSPSGYLVTPLEMPKTFAIAIESRLGRRIVDSCRGVGFLLGLDCDGLAQLFEQAAIPLPETGETYLVEASRLSAAERGQLDSFLLANGVKVLQTQ